MMPITIIKILSKFGASTEWTTEMSIEPLLQAIGVEVMFALETIDFILRGELAEADGAWF